MGERVSVKKHRFILTRYVDTTPTTRRAIVQSAPSVFFTVARTIGRKALKLGIRSSFSKKLVNSRGIKDLIIKNNKIFAEVVQKVLENESLYSGTRTRRSI